jgi:hypothetical protein
MAHTDDMINIAQDELQQLVGQDASSVCESKERMVCENGAQPHRSRMQYRLMAETAQAGMAMYNLNLLSYNDISKDGKERKNSREGCCSIDDEKWYMVNLEAVGEVSHPSSSRISMRYYDDFVAAVNQLG